LMNYDDDNLRPVGGLALGKKSQGSVFDCVS
jgi:hypothetical protein